MIMDGYNYISEEEFDDIWGHMQSPMAICMSTMTFDHCRSSTCGQYRQVTPLMKMDLISMTAGTQPREYISSTCWATSSPRKRGKLERQMPSGPWMTTRMRVKNEGRTSLRRVVARLSNCVLAC